MLTSFQIKAQFNFEKELINSKKDFEQVTRSFKEGVKRYNEKKIKLGNSKRDSIFSAARWSQKFGTRLENLQGQFQVLYWYDQMVDNPKIIEEGTALLSQEDFLKLPESSIAAKIILVAYRRSGLYSKELEVYPLFKKLNELYGYNAKPKPMSNEYPLLAKIYYNLENYELARDNYKKLFQSLLKNGDRFRAASQLNNIALTYERENNYNKALDYYNKSVALLNKDDMNTKEFSMAYKKHFKHVVLSNIASLKMYHGNLIGIEDVFKTELESSKKIGTKHMILQSYKNLSQFYYLKGNKDLAIIYNDSAIAYLKFYKNPKQKSDIYTTRAKLLLLDNKISEAHRFFNKAIFIKDSLRQSFKKLQLDETTINFNLKQTIEKLEKTNDLLSHKTKITYYQWILIFIVLLTGILIWWQYLKINKKSKQLAEEKNKTEIALKAKQIMLDEIHHRIKNNLQVVSGIIELKSTQLTNIKDIGIVKNAQNFIQSMVFIHQHLYAKGNEKILKMQSYFEDLTSSILQNYEKADILYSINASEIILNSEDATPLGLITTELITNSIKHAFDVAGNISITLSHKNGLYTFIYKDDGKGFDFEKNYGDKHQGIQLIKLLIEELQAEVEESINNGYQLQLIFNV